MSDSAGLLSKEEKDRAIDWLQEKGAEHQATCSICGNGNWMIGDHVVSAPRFSKGLFVGGIQYPLIMLICTTCGNTQFLNAVLMKALDKDQEPKKTSQPKKKAVRKKKAIRKKKAVKEKSDG